MPEKLVIDPSQLHQFGEPMDSAFCLVTNPELIDVISILPTGGYREYLKIPFRPGERFADVLPERVPEPAHVLAISPKSFFESPSAALLGPRRKLMGMACNSTPTSIETITHFLSIMEHTSAADQARFSDRFFEQLNNAQYLVYVDERRGTRAVQIGRAHV